MLLARDIEAAEAIERIVDRTVGDAELRGRSVCGIVTDIDVLTRRCALRRDLAVLLSVDLAEAEIDAAREVEIEILDSERIGRRRQFCRMRLDLHVGLAVRARLRRARQRDLARGLDVRRLLERCALDIDIARLRRAADLDLAVIRVVDVPVARTRADVDGLRLRRLFERELLADIDLVIPEVEIVGFDLRVVRGVQLTLNREFLPRRHLDIRRFCLEAIDVLHRIYRAVFDNGDFHVGIVLELQTTV